MNGRHAVRAPQERPGRELRHARLHAEDDGDQQASQMGRRHRRLPIDFPGLRTTVTGGGPPVHATSHERAAGPNERVGRHYASPGDVRVGAGVDDEAAQAEVRDEHGRACGRRASEAPAAAPPPLRSTTHRSRSTRTRRRIRASTNRSRAPSTGSWLRREPYGKFFLHCEGDLPSSAQPVATTREFPVKCLHRSMSRRPASYLSEGTALHSASSFLALARFATLPFACEIALEDTPRAAAMSR